jgi:hypothetical protein
MCARNDRENLDRANPGQHIGFAPAGRGQSDLSLSPGSEAAANTVVVLSAGRAAPAACYLAMNRYSRAVRRRAAACVPNE